MYSVSKEISDLKAEFESGAGLSVDWYSILRRAGNNMLDNIYPDTLKRVVPIYGGLTQDLIAYYSPEDVLTPSDLFSPVERRGFKYRASNHLWWKNESKTFSLEYINGKRRILVRAPSRGHMIIDDMNALGTKTADVPLSVNEFNFVSGSGAIEGTFSDTLTKIQDSFTTVKDITQYLRGALIVPLYWDDVKKVASVEFRLETNSGNYYKLTSTVDAIGDNFHVGQNWARFSLTSAVKVGNPNPGSIASWKLFIVMNSGQSQKVVIDQISLHKSQFFNFEYYSNRVFVDGSTGAWKDEPGPNDFINLDRDAAGILHYEAAILVGRPPVSEISFADQLQRKYQQYWANHPSTAQPVSYNIMPDLRSDGDFEDIEHEEEIYTSAIANTPKVEVPTGAMNGINATFTLSNTPVSDDLTFIYLNGQLLTLGQDYNLSGKTLVFTNPASLAGGVLLAVYYVSAF